MRLALLTAFSLVTTLELSAQERHAPEAERQAIESIRATLRAELEREALTGLQATIWRDGNALLSASFGVANLEHAAAVTSETRMPIASVTKALTGILYLRLVSRGVLDPEADVRTLVPEFPEQPGTVIRLRHLIGQTHGIRHYRDEIFPGSFTTHYERLSDALEIFANDPLVAPPGTRFTYSSYAYTLLGVAIERATDRAFDELLRSEVIEPAGMRRTRPNRVLEPIAGRATCYSHYDFRWPFERRDALIAVPPLDFTYNGAGGNLLSTTDDLVRFGAAVLAGDLLGDAGLDRLMTSQSTDDGEATGWSHGWFVRGEGRDLELRINGSNPGSWAHLRVYPKRRLVVALATNCHGRTSRERPRGLMGLMDRIYALLTA